MKKVVFYLLFFTVTTSVISCNNYGVKPKKIFTKIGLNGNKIPGSFKSHFKEIRGHIANGSLTIVTQDNEVKKGVTAVEYVENHYLDMFEADIEGIKELVYDEESKPIIDAGLELFQFAQKIYKEDFPRIAKMIDEGKPGEEIDAAIEELDNTKGIELDKKYDETMDLLLPYADKNGVKYKVQKSRY